jgi:hypothetical protein
LALPGPSTPASGSTTTTHRGRPPSPRTAATRQVRPPRVGACSRAHSAAAATGAPHAGLACLVAQRSSAAAASPNPARVGHRHSTDQRASSAASPAPGLLGRRPSRPTARQPIGTSTRSRRAGYSAASTWSPTPPPEVGRDGRVRTDGGGHQTAGRWTGGQQTAGPPDPGRRHQVDRTPDGWTADGRRILGDDTGWVDTACWTRTAHRRHGWRPGIVDHGDNARPLDAGWKLRRAAVVWASNNPGQLSSTDDEGHHAPTDGPGHRRDGQLQVLRRRPAGASAHCCPQTISGRA